MTTQTLVVIGAAWVGALALAAGVLDYWLHRRVFR